LAEHLRWKRDQGDAGHCDPDDERGGQPGDPRRQDQADHQNQKGHQREGQQHGLAELADAAQDEVKHEAEGAVDEEDARRGGLAHPIEQQTDKRQRRDQSQSQQIRGGGLPQQRRGEQEDDVHCGDAGEDEPQDGGPAAPIRLRDREPGRLLGVAAERRGEDGAHRPQRTTQRAPRTTKVLAVDALGELVAPLHRVEVVGDTIRALIHVIHRVRRVRRVHRVHRLSSVHLFSLSHVRRTMHRYRLFPTYTVQSGQAYPACGSV
jgi:hypothetical protein